MKVALALVSTVIFGIAGLAAGSMYQSRKDGATSAAFAKSTIAVIGVTACGQWLGGMTVSGSGALSSDQHMNPGDAVAMSKALPEANAGVVTIPCPSQGGPVPRSDSTRRDGAVRLGGVVRL